MLDDRKTPLKGRIGGPKGIAGPSIRAGGSTLPCGCNAAQDEDSKLRLYFCAPHAVAYEMLEVLQASLEIVDNIANNPPSPDYDIGPAMEVGMKARKVLRKAKGARG